MDETYSVPKHSALERAESCLDCSINAAAVADFINAVEEKNLLWHSIMIIRDGRVAAECFRYPYSANTPHCMFSISKNITGLALGFAVTEGAVNLDDKVIDWFPEYAPKKQDPYLEKLLVRHLASMNSGKAPSYFLNKTDRDWISQFFDAKWEAAPGKKFRYVNENMSMLCAIIRRATGVTVSEYLTDRLYKPLGIETPYWETDWDGTEAGGWGIRMKPEDFAKIFLCIQQHGIFNGKQVIPAEWLKLATLNQSELFRDPGPCKKSGYGFSFWRKSRHIYYGEGMYGQLAVINEKTGLLLIINSGETHTGRFWDAYNRFNEKMTDISNVPPGSEAALKEKLRLLSLPSLPESFVRSPLEAQLNGKTIHLRHSRICDRLGLPMSIMPLPSVYMTKDKGGDIDEISLEFTDNAIFFSWREQLKTENRIKCSLDSSFAFTEGFICSAPALFAASAHWENIYTLIIEIRPMTSTGARILNFDFTAFPYITMIPTSVPPIRDMIDSVAWTMYGISDNKLYKSCLTKALKRLETVAEPPHTGSVTA